MVSDSARRRASKRKRLKTLTGHKTDSVFDRYDIVDEVRLEEAGSRLEALYGSRPSQNRHNRGTEELVETP